MSSIVRSTPVAPLRKTALLAITMFCLANHGLAQNRGAVRVEFDDRPSFRFGKVLRADFRAKFQTDFRRFSPERDPKKDTFDLKRARFGIQGTFLKYFEYEVEREFRKTDSPWKDVMVNLNWTGEVQVRAGKFKVPFSREQMTGAGNLDFVFRSRIADQIAPGRQSGLMIHGRLFSRALAYEAGTFRKDGEIADFRGARTVAARVTSRPLRPLRAPSLVRNLEIGAAATSTRIAEGLNSLQGRTVAGDLLFGPMYVKGRRIRLGAEIQWMPGPFSVQGEFVDVHEDREGQGVRGNDLPDLVSRGWHLSGSWAITGEDKSDGINPKGEFPRGRGAIEVAARYEQLRLGSAEHPGRAFRTERSPNILGSSDRVWTFGVNWYANRWVKIQANSVREWIEDAQRRPDPDRDRYWLHIVRLQFVM